MSVLQPALNQVTLKGSKAEVASNQQTIPAGTRVEITREEGAAQIELYVIEGAVSVRADGQEATATTGRPLGENTWRAFAAASIDVYAIEQSIVRDVHA